MNDLLLPLSILLAVSAVSALDIVVSPHGNDAAAGTADAPLASLTAARDKARQQAGAVRIVLQDGVYRLTEPLVLGPEDSNVSWVAAPGAKPVISGGRTLTGFRVENGRWVLDIPEAKGGGWKFSQLFVNGQRRYRPRLPKQGYSYVAKEMAPTEASAGKGWDRFKFAGDDLRADWHNLGDVEVLNFNHWNMARLRIQSIDTDRRVVTFTGPTCNISYWAGLQAGNRYLVENVREALDQPGEWYLDTVSGRLEYLPLPGEDPATAEVIAPVADQLLVMKGDAAAGLVVDNVTFDGLTFAYTHWVCPPRGNSFPQAEANLSAAIAGYGVQHLTFTNCTVEHTGAWALHFIQGCRDNVIERNVFVDLGAGGMMLGTQGIPGDKADHSGWTTIRENTFAHGGRLHPAAHGVWIGHSPHNVIQHNDIHDFYYTGISVGWRWGYAESLAHDNLIEDNEVWQIGQGVLSDMGGIYTLGPSPGTVIRHNYFHDINAYTYGGWGIYFDEGSSDIEAVDNLVYRTKTGGFHQHYGKDNHFHNNIVAFARIGQIQRTRPEDHISFRFEGNIVYWDQGLLLHGNWKDAQYVMERNLYWQANGEPFNFAGRSLAEWQAAGHDTKSVIADPLFVDPQQGDFGLQPGTPAAQIGFKPFPLTGWGRSTPGGEEALKPVPPAYVMPVGDPPLLPVDEDFEDAEVGAKCPGARTYEDEQVTTATARVTDELAAAGQRCLKFQDQPGQKDIWNPHVYYDPRFASGTVEERFDLRLEPGASLTHEWRDMTANPYKVGPAISVAPDGTLKSGDRELLKLPHNSWVNFRIRGKLGDDQDGQWQLTVTVAGQQPQSFDLTCGEDMKVLRWMGWTSHANSTVAFYLDNVWCGPVD